MLTGGLKTRWLLHKHGLVRGQDAVEEGHLDVELAEVPVQRCGKVGDGPKGLQSRCWCGSFVIVNSELLHETLGHVTDLAVHDIPCIILFVLADELAP